MSAFGQGPRTAARPVEAPQPLRGTAAPARRRATARRNALTAVLSVAGHLLVLLVLVQTRPEPPKVVEDEPMVVQLVELEPPAEAPKPLPLAPAPPKPVKPPPPRRVAKPAPSPPPEVKPLYVKAGPSADGTDELSDSVVASAMTAGSGPGGGACNMPRRLQDALRKDPQVQAAMAAAYRGKALQVWNGAWVRRPGQEGAGLATVREAIMWEVGFAPPACRADPVNGMVLISLNDSPGAPRLVVGAGRWHWSDLLFAR